MKSHEAPVTESMQQCIDYIKQNEDEIAEYVNSLFLAQKDVIREQLLESLAAMLNPIPTHYEWRSNDCPYDYSGELYEDGKVSLEQTVSEFLESEYTGASRATYVSHYGLSYNTYGDSLSDDTLEIGCSPMELKISYRGMQGFRVNDSPVKNFSTSKPNVTNLTRYTTNAAPAISFGLLPL